MSEESSGVVKTTLRDGRLTLTLARPAVHNALDGEVIGGIAAGLRRARTDDAVRYVVLAGEGRSFCAGADLGWMSKMATSGLANDASVLATLLDEMVLSPKPVIARVHGAALGGGVGLVAACDLAVAAPRATFGLTEVRLGLVPAMIFPYLLRKVARHRLLEAALTGDRFKGAAAEALGLVNRVDDDLDGVIDAWGESFKQSGPRAMGTVKELFFSLPLSSWVEVQEKTTAAIAAARASEEGQEGMRAFLERRPASWVIQETAKK